MDGEKRLNVLYSTYVDEFLETLPIAVREKIVYNVKRVIHGIVKEEWFKKIESSGIWEFKTPYVGMTYRVLAFFDKDTRALIIATHGFVKKSQKTPKKEIERVKELRNLYYKDKNNSLWKIWKV